MGVQRWLRHAFSATVVFSVLAGCFQAGTQPTNPLPQTDTRCTNEGVKDLLDRFVQSVGEGQKDAVMQFFDRSFIRYGALGIEDGKPSSVAISTLERLDDYFAERFRQHEELRLVELDINTQITTTTSRVDFGAQIYRKADDLASLLGPNGSVVDGKGAVDCVQGKIWVFSTGS